MGAGRKKKTTAPFCGALSIPVQTWLMQVVPNFELYLLP